jgi:hypothetical protein
LKGHGFSRADFEAQKASALAAEGCIPPSQTFPKGLKPRISRGFLAARLKPCPFKTRLSPKAAKAVPFQNKNPLNFHVYAITQALFGLAGHRVPHPIE